MDTHRLKYFLRIAEEKSITRAAGLLGIAQPALSRQLALLEDELGVALFTRNRRGVELTDAGERLRASTAAPLRQLELAVQYAGSPVARLDRNVLIGLLETAVDVLAAPAIASLTEVFPHASFSVTAGSSDQLVEAMLKGAVDVALINPVPDERVFYRDMVSEALVVVGGPDSELHSGHAVPFSDVVDLPLVIPRSATGVATLVRNAALRNKVTVGYRVTTDSLAVTKTLIEAGLAYGVLPTSACRREIERGQLRCAPISEPVLTLHVGVAATAQLDLPREFVVQVGETLRGEVANLVESGTWDAQMLSSQPWNPSRG